MSSGTADARLRERAGSRALSIFTYGLSARVLRGHAEGPLPARDLSATIGWASPSSLRKSVAHLCDLGVLGRREADNGSRSRTTELTEAGRDLQAVADGLERWLRRAPSGPIELESPVAAGVIRALLGGWDTGVVRFLAEDPLTVGELRRRVGRLSNDSLERRVNKMCATDLLVRTESPGRRRLLVTTRWLRHAVAPLCTGCAWERRHVEERPRLGPGEAKAAYLLLAPLLELPPEAGGSCVLAMLTDRVRDEAGNGVDPEVAGVTVSVRESRLETRAFSTTAEPDSWALGTAEGWLRAVADGDPAALRISGANPTLPALLVRRMHEVLFRPQETASA